MVSYDDFKKLDIRIGKIVSAEEPEGSEKILKLIVDVGGEERQVLAGIKNSYKTEELIGREVVLIVNLEKKKIMGMESEAMVLAAKDREGKPVLLIPEQEVLPGSQIT